MRTKWKEMTVKDKALFATKMIVLLYLIILEIFQFSGKVENSKSIMLPLVGIYLTISAFQEWNKDRDSASIYVILAIFALIITLAIWIGK